MTNLASSQYCWLGWTKDYNISYVFRPTSVSYLNAARIIMCVVGSAGEGVAPFDDGW